MKNTFIFIIAAMCVMLKAIPVVQIPDTPPETYRPTVKVGYSKELTFENALNSPLWDKMPSYPLMCYVTDITLIDVLPMEKGTIKYLYNDDTFFVRADMTDSDVMTIAKKNQGVFFLDGDVLEVFVKPENRSYYWEFYCTPNKFFTTYFFPARGTLGVPSIYEKMTAELRIDAKINGTLNNGSDKDRSWIGIIAIPRKELERYGIRFEAGNKWTVMSSRYNFSRYLPFREQSSYPQCTCGFHSTEYYAEIEFINLDPEKK